MIKLNKYLISFLLVISIVFPTVFVPLKLAVFAATLFLSLCFLNHFKLKLSSKFIFLVCFFPLIGIVYSVYGVILNNPGALKVITVMVVYPLIFPIYSFAYNKGDEVGLYKVFTIAATLLIFVNMTFVISGLVVPGNAFEVFLNGLWPDDAVIDSGNDEYFKFTLPNISSLCFLLAYFVALFFEIDSKKEKIKISILIFLMVLLTFMSGRRALFLVMFLGPLLAYFFARSPIRLLVNLFKLKTIFYFSIGFVAIFLLIIVSGYEEYFYQMIMNIFNFSGNDSNIERRLQFDALWNAFLENPIFGAGAGASTSYIRSEEQPWAYELSYVAFLFQYGLLGFLAYTAGVIFVLINIRNMAVHNIYAYAIFSGLISFLIANATNPYLAKFDYMWVIFIPFCIWSGNKFQSRKEKGN